MTNAAGAPSAVPLLSLHRTAIRLEQFSVGWMVIEAGVAVTAGIISGSLALTSFGFDSVIEIVSAALVLGRLCAELRGSGTTEAWGCRGRGMWCSCSSFEPARCSRREICDAVRHFVPYASARE